MNTIGEVAETSQHFSRSALGGDVGQSGFAARLVALRGQVERRATHPYCRILDSEGYPGVPLRRGIDGTAADAHRAAAVGTAGHSALSNAHTPPRVTFHQVEVWDGATLVQLSEPGESLSGRRGIRGLIVGYSRQAAQRMRVCLNKVDYPAAVAVDPLRFGTRTFPDLVPGAAEVKRLEDVFAKRFARRFPASAVCWKRELKRRKSGLSKGHVRPHFHEVIYGMPSRFPFLEQHRPWFDVFQQADGCWVERIYAISRSSGLRVLHRECTYAVGEQDSAEDWYAREWFDLAGGGCWPHYYRLTADKGRLQVLANEAAARCYMTKQYVTKHEDDVEPGNEYHEAKSWGCRRWQNVPKGQRVVIPISAAVYFSLLRIGRKFVASKSGRRLGLVRSLFVGDVAQWRRCISYVIAEHNAPF
jgi:hypothetical protein